jgi:hypothetical protein
MKGRYARGAGRTLTIERRERRRAPALPNEYDWHPLTRRWWKDVWYSPMAGELLDSDVHGLYRLAVLVDRFWRDPRPTLAGEIRLENEAFGLSPVGRRRLQLVIEKVEKASLKG